jgi:sulfatase modifying factor 1
MQGRAYHREPAGRRGGRPASTRHVAAAIALFCSTGATGCAASASTPVGVGLARRPLGDEARSLLGRVEPSRAADSPSARASDSIGSEATASEPAQAASSSDNPVLESGPSIVAPTSSALACPSEMALVAGRVCIDRWEATVLAIEPSGPRALSPFEPLDAIRAPLRAVARPGVAPQGYISGRQAESACRGAGKRLCTAREWELGCRGPERTQFPYGPKRRSRVCNDDVRARHPVMEAASREGLDGERIWTDGMNLSSINQLPDSLEVTGARTQCMTSDGLFDMVGNLHEWVAEPDGTFRGGYYMDTSKNGEGCSYQTTAHDFEYHDYSTGFRCCADPEALD